LYHNLVYHKTTTTVGVHRSTCKSRHIIKIDEHRYENTISKEWTVLNHIEQQVSLVKGNLQDEFSSILHTYTG